MKHGQKGRRKGKGKGRARCLASMGFARWWLGRRLMVLARTSSRGVLCSHRKREERKERKRQRQVEFQRWERRFRQRQLCQCRHRYSTAWHFYDTSNFLLHACCNLLLDNGCRRIFMFLMTHVFRASCLLLMMSSHTSHVP